MQRKIMFILLMLSFLPFFVKAESCDLAALNTKKKLAQNINWTYEYYLEKDTMYFDITATNVVDDLYVIDTLTNKKYSNNEFTIKKILANQKINYEIYSKNCKELISTKSISLPAYNVYYSSEYCKGISEYSLCKKWGVISSKVTLDVLKKETDAYRLTLSSKPIEPIEYETKLTGLYIFAGLAIIFLIMFLIFLFHNKREKDFI